MLDELKRFGEVCADSYATARAAAASGRKVAGYMCSYSPQELLHAAGYLPVRILGHLGATPRADTLMQAFICSFARSTFECGLTGELDFFEVVMFAHTCDTMQNLADLWRGNCPGMKTIIASVPNVQSGAAALAYYRKELERVRQDVETMAGPIDDKTLLASLRLYGAHRAKMRELYALRRRSPGAMTGTEMMSVILSSFLMPREEHLELVSALIEKLEATDTQAPKVIVGGSVCQTNDFIAAIEAAGCAVVDDDLCMGSRSYSLPAIEGTNPMDLLTRAYMERMPCPAMHKATFDPAAAMLERVREAQAEGVVFLITKFCDPYCFDYAHVNSVLEAAGVPTLMIEVEQNLPVSEQMRTRMEAFVEILEARRS
jgi:bcr-type benzoyl-CoA reductase subunit C